MKLELYEYLHLFLVIEKDHLHWEIICRESNQRIFFMEQGDQLHDVWKRLGRILSERVELMQTYVRLHTMALQVSDAWNILEAKVSDVNDDTIDVKDVQELWLNGNQKYVQLTNLARNFMADALKVVHL